MGIDIDLYLIHGFKLPLSLAFKSMLIDPEIMHNAEYQLISEDNYRDDIIKRQITSTIIKDFLLSNKKWNIYILTTSQGDCDPEKSFLFLYDKKEYLCDEIYDYKTGVVEPIEPSVPVVLSDFLDKYTCQYNLHWIFESYY